MKTRFNFCVPLIGLVVATVLAQQKTVSPMSANQLTPAEKAGGWKLLFDGRTSDGWRSYRKDAFPNKGWVVEGGCLKVVGGAKGGDIITTGQYGDFELALEWREGQQRDHVPRDRKARCVVANRAGVPALG